MYFFCLLYQKYFALNLNCVSGRHDSSEIHLVNHLHVFLLCTRSDAMEFYLGEKTYMQGLYYKRVRMAVFMVSYMQFPLWVHTRGPRSYRLNMQMTLMFLSGLAFVWTVDANCTILWCQHSFAPPSPVGRAQGAGCRAREPGCQAHSCTAYTMLCILHEASVVASPSQMPSPRPIVDRQMSFPQLACPLTSSCHVCRSVRILSSRLLYEK